jgi:hypothetical protein
VDNENRKHFNETVGNIRQGMTPDVGMAIAKKNLGDSVRRGYWNMDWQKPDGSVDVAKREKARITNEDMSAVNKLQTQGYLDSNYNAKASPEMSTALLNSVFDAEVADMPTIQGLADSLKGASPMENAMFTEALRSGAGSHNYKNLQYADVSNGNVTQYHIKRPEDILNSSIRGINKDALDPDHDMTMLDAIQERIQTVEREKGTPAAYQARLEIIQQTLDIDKGKIIGAVADKLGITRDEMVQVRQALKTPSVDLPPDYIAKGGRSSTSGTGGTA